MLILQDITYTHPNGDLLFADLNLSINKHDKIALIGNNGQGKSTLLKILAGSLIPQHGLVKSDIKPYYMPQIFGQFNSYSIAEALQVHQKLNALHKILDGRLTEENLTILNDDWAIEDRCEAALLHWGLDGFDLNQKMETLSGGQQTKVFLAGLKVHQPQLVLLDEPTNHLDAKSRKMLINELIITKSTLIVVSHDRSLLNTLPTVYELHNSTITVYGGNYDFYAAQQKIAQQAYHQELRSKEKQLRKARETAREAVERQQKLDARGKKKQEKAGLPTIVMNTLKNNAEKSTAKLKGVHTEKVNDITKDLSQLRNALPDLDKMKMSFDQSPLHKGKVLIKVSDVNFTYGIEMLWKIPLNFQLHSGDRIALKGGNGTGKTTLIKMILGLFQPTTGSIVAANFRSIYIDQDYSIIDQQFTVYEQAQQYNYGALQEHEIKIRLNRFLFTKEDWGKPCWTLSGGEKMRLILCLLTINNQAPDLIVLDEPTNNLDLQSIEILTSAITAYEGTLLVVSHDDYFLEQINMVRTITLDGCLLSYISDQV